MTQLLLLEANTGQGTGETIYRDAVVVQQRPSVGCKHIFPHSCSNNIPSLVTIRILFSDTKIEDNSRAFKLQKANFDSEVNTAVGFAEKDSTFTVE